MRAFLSLLLLSCFCITSAWAQSDSSNQATLYGKVTDALDGSPLIGANVSIKGTTTGPVANMTGEFVPESTPLSLPT